MKDEEAVFAEVAGVRSPVERAALLDRACAGDGELQRRVEALVRAHDRGRGILDVAPAGLRTDDQPPPATAVGSHIGPFKLLELIGEGGMGAVYMAEQQRPVRRMVALKIIKPGMDTSQVVARFEAERQALAMMDHPNIARVLDAGATDVGRLYFVMELVKGVPITDYCDANRLAPRQRLELFVQVCHAVQHAHQKGVIHRDLKPTNVLVTLYDGRPVPKVIDFGIAKATHGRLTDLTLFTNFAKGVGTPLYMSPEQAGLSGQDVDTRSDVYSLGVMLYELLTGTTPFDKKRLSEAAWDEILRIIREEEPPTPSARIGTLGATLPAVSGTRATEPKKLGQLVRGELDWVVMKAMEKDRGRRYDSASALAADVLRHLNDVAVEACPASRRYRLRKFVRKYRVGLMTAAAFAVVLLAASAVSTYMALVAQEALRDAAADARLRKDALDTTETINRFVLEDLLAQADPKNGGHPDLKLRMVLDRAAARVERRFHDRPAVEAKLRATLANTFLSLGELEKAQDQFKRASELNAAADGPGDGRTCEFRNGLARALFHQGRLDEAEAMARDILDTHRKEASHECSVTYTSMTLLAQVAEKRGHMDEALRLYRESHGVCQRVLGGDHAATLNAIDGLAKLLQTEGYLDEAEALFRERLDAIRLREGLRSNVSLNAAHNLANAWRDLGRLEEAAKMLEDVLASKRSALGDDDDSCRSTGEVLAAVYADLGRMSEAESLQSEVVSARRRDPGPDNPVTLASERELALIFVLQRRAGEAESILRRVFAAQTRLLSPGHESLIRTIEVLGNALGLQGKWQESHDLYREAYEQSCTSRSTSSPATLQRGLNLADALERVGRREEACTLLERVITTQRELKRSSRPAITTSIRKLAAATGGICWPILSRADAPAKDVERAASAARRFTKIFPQGSSGWGQLAAVDYREGDWKGAAELAQKSIRLQSRSQGNPLMGLMLAMANARLGDQQAARSWYTVACLWHDDEDVRRRDTDCASLRKEAAALLDLPEVWPPESWQASADDRAFDARLREINPLLDGPVHMHEILLGRRTEHLEPPGPYGGAPAVVPGTIEAEEFDRGGPGLGYREETPYDSGSLRPRKRATIVDLDACEDESKGANVAGTRPGEWLAYTIEVAEDGSYELDIRLSGDGRGGRLHVEFDGSDLTGAIEVPNTGGWQKWRTATSRAVHLRKGRQVMRVIFDRAADGTDGNVCNFNWVRVRASIPSR